MVLQRPITEADPVALRTPPERERIGDGRRGPWLPRVERYLAVHQENGREAAGEDHKHEEENLQGQIERAEGGLEDDESGEREQRKPGGYREQEKEAPSPSSCRVHGSLTFAQATRHGQGRCSRARIGHPGPVSRACLCKDSVRSGFSG